MAARRWQFAKTMPQNPHEYTVRDWDPDEASFERFAALIRQHGWVGVAFGREWTYLDVGRHTYWTMGAPLPETTVINRKAADGVPGEHAVRVNVPADSTP